METVLRHAKGIERSEKHSKQIASKSKNADKMSREVEKAIETLEKGLKRKRIADAEHKNDIDGKRFKRD